MEEQSETIMLTLLYTYALQYVRSLYCLEANSDSSTHVSCREKQFVEYFIYIWNTRNQPSMHLLNLPVLVCHR